MEQLSVTDIIKHSRKGMMTKYDSVGAGVADDTRMQNMTVGRFTNFFVKKYDG